MSIEEKVGQTMIWTFAGTSFSKQTEELISRYKLGALIAFSRNIKTHSQIAKFNSDAQKFAGRKLKVPLFIMIDQEGGMVTRVKLRSPLPSALAVGHMQDPAFIESYAKTSAELLSALGFNVNLSPVMDMSDPEVNSFISNRVFGSDPEQVAISSLAYARGIAGAGLIPTAKHFPGHGGLVTDSHRHVARKDASLEELEARDLVPFVKYSAQTFPKAVMMAHMSLPSVDPSGVPATYSAKLIQEILRGKYGYNGLVMTDDLEMGGASVSPDVGERAVRAFLAGNDLLMLAGAPANQRRAFEAMVAAVKKGRISKVRLDESVARILEIKKILDRPSLKLLPGRNLEIRTKLEALSREIMRKNFRDALKSKTSHWPTVDEKVRVAVFTSDRRFYATFAEHFIGKTDLNLLTPATLARAAEAIESADHDFAVFYASGDVTAKWLSHLKPELRAKTIVVNCNNPGKIPSARDFLGVLSINSHSPESGAWLAEELISPADMRTPATAEDEEDDASPEHTVDKSPPIESGHQLNPERSFRRPPRSSNERAEDPLPPSRLLGSRVSQTPVPSPFAP